MVNNLLEIKNLKVSFSTDDGLISPVDGVSLEMKDGETLAVVGESGCGKSLTALSIMGLIDKPGRIAEGEIIFQDRDIVNINKEDWYQIRGKEMAMIFQEPLTSLNPVFTIGSQISESIILHQKVNKKEAKKRSIELLKRVGMPLEEKIYESYPHSLSGGMRQRAMIAIALSCNPKMIIADEPTTALDVTIQAQILDLLRGLSREYGTSIMLITHDLGVVAEMADYVTVMYAGQVVEKSDVFSFFEDPKHPYSRGLLNSTPQIDEVKAELKTIEGVVPNPFNIPQGCRFYPRCNKAQERCRLEQPVLRILADEKAVRCWLYED
jgi:oligopeptide/dipeptide ABC transporter ATP-binding protein